MNGVPRIPEPVNEPVRSYAPGTAERASLKAELTRMSEEIVPIPLVIGNERMTGNLTNVVVPHDHQHVIGRASAASAAQVQGAMQAAMDAKKDWAQMSFEARASIFLRAANLLEGPFRDRINASTMLGQSKTCYQAEIDAACELIDFWRFNVKYAHQIREEQPISSPGIWNRVEQRPLDGFVFAITPFNFTSIAANLCTAPALMGNVVVWKPAPTQMHSAHVIMELLDAAGLPPGVINMVAGDAFQIGSQILTSPQLGGVHFTGSTNTFRHIWRTIGENISRYRQYPRIVGETGGKDFVFAHASANVETLACALVRGAYEFQGQKCSAASRAYVPRTLWPRLKELLVAQIDSIKMGDVQDFSNFMGAVIDERSFDKIQGYIEKGKSDADATLIAGGQCSKEKGYFIRPTLFETINPHQRLMTEEIFGPVLSVYVYDEKDFDQALELCDKATPYGLTGAIFAEDRYAIEKMSLALQNAAGNFYINDKPTGAVVGQQPFGGGRASGTNDKAGSAANLLRWTSPRSIKETFNPPTDYRYPFMSEE